LEISGGRRCKNLLVATAAKHPAQIAINNVNAIRVGRRLFAAIFSEEEDPRSSRMRAANATAFDTP
jgi:hypothetical protein